ncbi:PglL family O-oligosaccharyltransferase [Variovorax sp. CY25R-8]|uniref:PglL family O-oligosaccharyltransferase n=1 Tax=Variovorax sp. CY25R-8 TaxID=2855501 RepID=UPI0021BA6992|nr:Wzy polymerase domain-containing protein [Variovorax sp. CY25R-8]MCT8174917.1 O-antigen ligase C-terminal domain-containing protein [Variovorax sp. CY25R-8]
MTSSAAFIDRSLLRDRSALCACLVTLSFLCPLVAGPSANLWQLLCAGMCAALFMLVASSGGRSAIARATVWGLLVAGALNAVLGLLQYYDLAEFLFPWITSPGPGRAWGTLRQRNQFATLINLALVASLWVYATSGSRRMRIGLAAAMVLLIAANAASGSRTGLLQLALIAGTVAWMAWQERRRGPPINRLPPASALLAMLPLYFALNWLLSHLAAAGTTGKALTSAGALVQRLQPTALCNESRLTLWHNVLSLIAERPLTGWGWGELSYAHFMAVYPGPRFPVLLDNAHNLPLHLAVELGIPAAVLICGGFLWLVISARPWRERDPNRLMAWGLLAVILVHSLLEYPLWYGPFQLVFGLCLGMLWPARRTEESSPRSIRKWLPDRRRFQALAGIALLSFVVYAAWDYTRISQIYLSRDARLPPWQDDTLAKVRSSWLFARQVDFAELTLTPVTHENAARMHALAQRTLHFSPEPRVIVKLIESAELSGHEDEARLIAERFREAYPSAYVHWLGHNPGDKAPAP